MATCKEKSDTDITNDKIASDVQMMLISGDLDGVIKHIQGVGTLTEDAKRFVIKQVIKYYSQYLSECAQSDGICLSSAWSSQSVKQSRIRSQLLNIIKLLFKQCLVVDVEHSSDTTLMAAVATHDVELIKLILENGADPNLRSGAGDMNAFALAIILNDISVIKLLLAYSASINERCCQNLTPLQLSMNKSVDVSKLLLQNGADIQQVMQMRGSSDVQITRPPLVHAVETDNLYLASILLEHGEDVNQAYGEHSNAPIHYSILQGSEDMLKLLIQYGANLEKRNARGNTPLGLALRQVEVGSKLCGVLIEAGCSQEKGSIIHIFQRRYPPTHIAAFLGFHFHLDFLKMLFVEQESECSITALSDTPNDSSSNQPALTRRQSLLNTESVVEDISNKDKHSFINLQAQDKSTALYMAVFGGNIGIAQFLHTNGADPYIPCIHGNLLHAAVISRSEEMLSFVLNLHFDINYMNDDGNTPLILSARSNNPQICRTLVQNGALLNVKDGKFGETALSASVYFGCEENAQTLICHGASPDIPDSRDTTALYWAIFNCREQTIKLLLEAGARLRPVELARYPRNIKVMRNEELRSLLRDYVEQPRSLQHCCRLSVRSHLCDLHQGRSLMGSLMSLPVPAKLKHFLALKNT